MRVTPLLRGATLLPLIVAGAGCVDFDVQTEVEDLRILAVRLDPPEVVYSAFMAMPAAERPPLPAPPIEVQATILAADPRTTAPLTFTTHLCPLSDSQLCADYAPPPGLAPELKPLLERRAAALDDADGLGTRRGELGRFSFSESALDFVLPHDDSGAVAVFFEHWARVVVQAENGGIKELAFRRLPFNVSFDFSMFPPAVAVEVARQFSEGLGLEICAPERALEEAPDCIKPRITNANPVIEELRYTLDDTRPEYDDVRHDTRARGEVLQGPMVLAPDARITLWPVFSDDADEPYQMLEIDVQAMTIEIGNYHEDLVVSWYATAPGLEIGMSELDLNRGFHTIYSFPVEEPPARVLVYMVARDQRGGVAFETIELVRDGG